MIIPASYSNTILIWKNCLCQKERKLFLHVLVQSCLRPDFVPSRAWPTSSPPRAPPFVLGPASLSRPSKRRSGQVGPVCQPHPSLCSSPTAGARHRTHSHSRVGSTHAGEDSEPDIIPWRRKSRSRIDMDDSGERAVLFSLLTTHLQIRSAIGITIGSISQELVTMRS